MNRLVNIDTSIRQEYSYPFSLDVVAFYTSIPVQDAIINLKDILERNNFCYQSLSPTDICELRVVKLIRLVSIFRGV
jgi:hypothetical protein